MCKYKITALVDNEVEDETLKGEHGLSCWLETPNGPLLFDTGQGQEMILEENARAMELDLASVSTMVLSHGHYDHTGAVDRMLDLAPNLSIYGHKDVFIKRYSQHGDGSWHAIGMSQQSVNALQGYSRFTSIAVAAEVLPGIHVSGPIPRETGESTGGNFYLDQVGKDVDYIYDDQALYFEVDDGVVVLLGCAHAGVMNTLKYVHELSGGKPVCSVIGGMHLHKSTSEHIDWVIEGFKKFGVKSVAPNHCTGSLAYNRFKQVYGDACRSFGAGATISFD